MLFSIQRQSGRSNAVAVLSINTGQKRVIVEDAAYGRLAPDGHLLFVRGGNLLAVPFNQQRLEIGGESIVAQAGFVYQASSRSTDFTLAAMSGAAAMVFRDPSLFNSSVLVWVDRQGRATPTGVAERTFRQPRLSPDGQRLAVDISGASSRDIWIYDFRRGRLSRLTTTGGVETPVWSPDGLSVAWAGVADGKSHVLLKRADGSDAERRIWSTQEHIHLNAWDPDGRSLLLNPTHGQLPTLLELTLLPDIRARPFLPSKFSQYSGAILPTAAAWRLSGQTGQAEVYLTTRTGVGKAQVSSAGGNEPVWSRDGRELFYRSGRRLMSVATATADSLDFGVSRLLFDESYMTGDGRDPSYDVSPDGQRFLMMQPVRDKAAGGEVVVTLNWLEELRKTRMPTK